MRIIAGRHRGRRLEAPTGQRMRPTASRLRESLFNILAHHPDFSLASARVADLFAGTGALGLEALSRGAVFVTFVDHHPASAALLLRNIGMLGETTRSKIVTSDATRLPRATEACDLIFADPPYDKGLIPLAAADLVDKGWVKSGALLVAEARAGEVIDLPKVWQELTRRRQGEGQIVIFRYKPEA